LDKWNSFKLEKRTPLERLRDLSREWSYSRLSRHTNSEYGWKSFNNAEEYWADMEGLEHRDTVTDFGLPEGTFFDCAVWNCGNKDALYQRSVIFFLTFGPYGL